MDITVRETELPGIVVIDTDYFRDDRGFFIENYHKQRFAEHGITDEFVQDNHSRSGYGVLRGIHGEPWNKYVTLAHGRAFAAIVDLRAGAGFGRVETIELHPGNAIFVPEGSKLAVYRRLALGGPPALPPALGTSP